MLVAIAITNSVPSANGFDGSASSSARTASIIILPPRKTSNTNAIQWSVPSTKRVTPLPNIIASSGMI